MSRAVITRLIVASVLPEAILATVATLIIDDPDVSFWICLGVIYGFSFIIWLTRTLVSFINFLVGREDMKSEIRQRLTQLEFPLVDFDFFSDDLESYYEGVAFQEGLPEDELEMKRRMFAVGVLNTLSWLRLEGRWLGVRRVKKLHREAIRDLRSLRVADSLPL